MTHMPLFENIRKCVSRRHGLSRRVTRVLFNVKINESFKSQNVPSQIRDLLVYIAREGVAVTDLFRRPGNPQDMKKIISDLEAGRPIKWTDYNFYTLANIAKRYLLHIEGGILGPESEEKLLSTLDIPDDQARIEAMHSVIVSQSKPVQQLLALLFGIWFRMIYHTEVNAMSVEAVAKSVAGSVFPSCTTTPRKVERASKVMEYLITGFASADLFSRELIEYFTLETKTSISRVEKFKYEFRFPKDVPREKSVRLFVRMLLEEGRKHGFHLINDDTGEFDLMNAPIQQTSEKRTCVTTAPIGKTVVNLDPLKTHDLPNPISTGNNADHPSTNFKLPSSQPDGNRGHDTKIKSAAYRTPSSQSVCFNSVKRRQLERLQKRSDWFLSPPAGLRSSTGLMHLNPNAIGTVHGFTSQVQNKLNAAQNNDRNLRNYPVAVSTEPNSSSDLDSTSLMDIELSDDMTAISDYNQHVSRINVHNDDVDVNDIGQLVFSAPERIWNCHSDVYKSSTLTTGCKRHSHALGLPERIATTIPPTASSSPNWPQLLPPTTDYSIKGSSIQPVIEEKENYPEVETRYYVVERYYGPEPRPPSKTTNQHLSHDQQQELHDASCR
ncbi:Rho GTPase-activating protein isoform 3 [Schistosoma japonicum]|uniref:Rho GTPase-activating protein isoform 3 n=4 Tax=Schistosoma japonicum TaxID=6182 RepID=A0A4Z2CUV0_SCHJA|nr:Rho GTPase-activating protein 20 [Schistosoma japonicum]TNN08029.1 Rho GTPase-activating protein isoform 3 [Schistosoma japonicum]